MVLWSLLRCNRMATLFDCGLSFQVIKHMDECVGREICGVLGYWDVRLRNVLSAICL